MLGPTLIWIEACAFVPATVLKSPQGVHFAIPDLHSLAGVAGYLTITLG
jgi:hypothetical protein